MFRMFVSRIVEIITLYSAVTIVANAQNNENVCHSPECHQTADTFQRHMKPSTLPCHNFYEFMCGNFYKWNKVHPGSGTENSFTIRERYVNEKIAAFLKSNDYNYMSSARKARISFKNCLDEAAIEALGHISIPTEMNIIGLPLKPPFNLPLNERYDFSRLLAKMHRYLPFASFLFDVTVFPDENDAIKNYVNFGHTPTIHQITSEKVPPELEVFAFNYRISEKEKSEEREKEVRQLLKDFMNKVIDYMNEITNAKQSKKTHELIENRINEVLDFLMELQKTKELENPAEEGKLGKPTYMTLSELQNITDEILADDSVQIKINWFDYMETLFEGIRSDTRELFLRGELIRITNKEQFEKVLKLLSKVKQKVLVSTIWWIVVQSTAAFGTKELRKWYFDYIHQLDKQDLGSREVRCLQRVKNHYGFLFAFVLTEVDANASNIRDEVAEMIVNIRDSYEETFTKSKWLDESTKMAAINKLKYISQLVSYQNWMRNPNEIESIYEENVEIPGLYYASSHFRSQRRREKNLSFIGTNNDLSWGMTPSDPHEVNAFYSPFYNGIDIPIGILGPPFIGLGLRALNYGAIGVIMSHEVGHGFDNNGKLHDSWGKGNMWWKKKTNDLYNEKTQCYIDSYNKIYIPEAEATVNGKLTLGENMADNQGFQQALKAYKRSVAKNGPEKLLPKFEHYSHERLFTMAYANLYCDLMTQNFAKFQIKFDEHSAKRARILGVVKNSAEFSRIWNCSEDSDMNEPNKCELW